MKTIIVHQDSRVSRFVASRIGMNGAFGSCSTIGVEQDDELIAGAVYEQYNGRNVFMHVAGIGRTWMNREILWFSFYYPFEQLKANRITLVIDDSNKDSINLARHLGFTLETKLHDAGRSGDLLIYRMLKEECRFLRMKHAPTL